jgi:hypothetical protein
MGGDLVPADGGENQVAQAWRQRNRTVGAPMMIAKMRAVLATS